MELCKIYLLKTSDKFDSNHEQLFVIRKDGKIETTIRKYSVFGYNADDVWKVVDKIDDEAKFIGSYCMRC